MSFKGALLKPSERAVSRKSPSRVSKMSTIVDKDPSRFDELKRIVHSGLETVFEVGAALIEIKRKGYYKPQFPTFEAFCESEFKIVRSRAYQLIKAAKVKSSLPPAVAVHVENEGQARALAAVPEESRVEVVEEAVKAGPLTAERITETASQITSTDVSSSIEVAPPEEPKKRLDKTGYPIPDAVLEDWKDAEEFRVTLNELQRIKNLVGKALDEKKKIFRFIDQSAVIDLKNAWTTLKQVLPYAVCPSCQGRNSKKCSACKELGYVPQFGYEHWFAKEVIEIREKAIKK